MTADQVITTPVRADLAGDRLRAVLKAISPHV